MTRYEKFMRLPRVVRLLIVALLFVPSWVAAQPSIIAELWSEAKGAVK